MKTEILIGKDAQQVLDNDAYKQAMAKLKTDVLETWKQCPIRDAEGQRLLLQLAKLTDKFEGILGGMIETGKLAQHKLDIDNLRNESRTRQYLRKIA